MEEQDQPQDYIKGIHFKETSPSQADLARLRGRIWNDIRESTPTKSWWNRPYYAIAASLSLLVVSASIAWWAMSPAHFHTAYGQIRKITLEDGSVVTLNANSDIRVANNLAESAVREVWLEGEAYFDIAKRNGAKFIVHTPEAQVEVLGTEFNVMARRQNTKVVLHEGKVKLHAANAPAVVMKPGDMATVTERKEPIRLQSVRPELYDSWKESMVVLDGKPVVEITQMLLDNYGISVTFADTNFLSKKLDGKLSLQSTDDFITNLATILDLEIEKRGKDYVFR
ncbi:hypothetical protein GCM10010967_23900 [Dyadobacter beijingensis]|uniref:FecR protein domain-containing protein n=1 Tax=Dyadobacter beijingensis TaxID=365489 RepID=A0ABQ2HS89_9BACT|nr:FecR domain-containing protein [Dyadobacter beijingensis]GGM90185.1 hypothetical protein GCM10010967_23900 [Dyadobacter beijingensis]